MVLQLILNSIIIGSVYALVAMGFNLIYGTSKFFNFAHCAVGLFGAYVVFYFNKTIDLDILSSFIIGVLSAGLLGYFLYKIIFSNLQKNKASSMVFIVASLGVLATLQALMTILFNNQFKLFSLDIDSYNFFNLRITQAQLIIIITVIIMAIMLSLLLKKTNFGKAVRAIGDEEDVATIVGINTKKIIGLVFFIGSAISGVAMILIGLDIGLEPSMGTTFLFKGVIASIIGGVGNVYGGVVGGLLLGFIENFGAWKISGEWKDALSFFVLIIFLLFRPQGIFKK